MSLDGFREIESIASTRLVPPRAARGLIARDALQARLLEARRQRCVIVHGPAGSGKTSTLVAWRQALLSLNFDVAWLSVAAEDNEPTRFFGCLLASIAVVDADVVREAAMLTARDSSATAFEHGVITMVEAISRRARDLVLIIDDVQLLHDARIHQALQWLLEYAPPNLHLALSTRTAPELSLARLNAQGQVSDFGLKDLRFSPEESERFLREQLGHIDHRDAQVLHDLTDGWVAGLQLFAVDLKAKRGAGFARIEVRDAQAFANYFEREVLCNLAPDDLFLLTRTATCNRFCASLCATLINQPGAVASMTSRLARMDADNLFISQVSSHDRESWYRVHPLLREILLERLELLPEDTRRALHGRVSRWFEQRDLLDEAVRHAVLAGEVRAAADIVERCAMDMMGRGELAHLASLMRNLPGATTQSRFTLRLTTAYLNMYAREFDALEAALRQLEAGWAAMDVHERFAVRLLQTAFAMQRDDSQAVRRILPDLLAIPDDAQPFASAGRAHAIAWLHIHEEQYELAQAMLDDAARQNPAPARRLVARALEGMSLSLQGRITEADRVLREVQHESSRHGAAYVDVTALAEAFLAETLYEFNEPEAACRLLEPRIEVLTRAAMPDAALRARVTLVRAHWLLGRRRQALEHLDHLEDYSNRHGLDRALAHLLSLRLRFHLEQDATAAAIGVLDHIRALGARHATGDSGTSCEVTRLCAFADALGCLHFRDYAGALGIIEPLLRQSATAGRRSREVGLQVALAVAKAGRRDHAAARAHLLDALRTAHRLGLARTLLDISPTVPGMLEGLLGADALDPVLAFYVKRLLSADGVTSQEAIAGDGTHASDPLNAREREILALVGQAMPNKKIARAIGVTTHTVKWHLRRIYQKLGVAERDEAVARMRDIDLAAGLAGSAGANPPSNPATSHSTSQARQSG